MYPSALVAIYTIICRLDFIAESPISLRIEPETAANSTRSTNPDKISSSSPYNPMRYLPKSPQDRERMLREIGIRSIDDLFAPIPAEYRLNRDLDIAPSMAESDILDW